MFTKADYDRVMPTVTDRLLLVPPPLRKVLGEIRAKAAGLITKDEEKKARIATMRSRVEFLGKTSKQFCAAFLQFLQKQNEELRTVALAANGSYIEAIPPERKSYSTYDPWSDGFNSQGNYGGSDYDLPKEPRDGAAAGVASHVDTTINGYIMEFTANITRKGRIAQIETFLDNFSVEPFILHEMLSRHNPARSVYYNISDRQMDYLIQREQKKEKLTQNPQKAPDADSAREYFVQQMMNDEIFCNATFKKYAAALKKASIDEKKSVELSARYLWSRVMTDEQLSVEVKKYEEHMTQIAEAKEQEVENETGPEEPSLEGLTGKNLRDAIMAGIRFHNERIAWLTSQLADAE